MTFLAHSEHEEETNLLQIAAVYINRMYNSGTRQHVVGPFTCQGFGSVL